MLPELRVNDTSSNRAIPVRIVLYQSVYRYTSMYRAIIEKHRVMKGCVMYCIHCGAELSDSDKFCTSCGKPTTNNGEALSAEGMPSDVNQPTQRMQTPAAVQQQRPVAPMQTNMNTQRTTPPTQPVIYNQPAQRNAQQARPAQQSSGTVAVPKGVLIAAFVIAALALGAFLATQVRGLMSNGSDNAVVATSSVEASSSTSSSSAATSSETTSNAVEISSSEDSAATAAKPATSSEKKENATSEKSSDQKQEQKQEQKPAAEQTGDYVLADSASRAYSRSELEKMDNHQLFLARNEIYARHGRQFKNEELQQYFGSKDWYKGTITPESFNEEAVFNQIEKDNVKIMLDIEKSRNSPYLN